MDTQGAHEGARLQQNHPYQKEAHGGGQGRPQRHRHAARKESDNRSGEAVSSPVNGAAKAPQGTQGGTGADGETDLHKYPRAKQDQRLTELKVETECNKTVHTTKELLGEVRAAITDRGQDRRRCQQQAQQQDGQDGDRHEYRHWRGGGSEGQPHMGNQALGEAIKGAVE